MTSMTHVRAASRRALGVVLALLLVGCGPVWATYHRDNSRSGSDTSAPDIVPVTNAWTSVSLDGLIYAQPLVYNNRVYVVTENDIAYALDLNTGQIKWSRDVGDPVRAASVPCPLNVDPLGITGTPVIDQSTNTIFFVAQLTNPVRHELFGLDTGNGAIKVNVSGDPPGVDKLMDHQRPALALGNGRVYWGYGGADCGTYHGKVVSVKTDGSSPLVYTVPSINRGSLWAPAGPSIDPDGNVWVATGDGTSTTVFDHTTSVIKLSPTLQELGYFAPKGWATLNANGTEIGSTGPLILPNGYVFQVGKNGRAFIVRQSAPGGIGGHVSALSIGCNSSGGNSWSPGMIWVECLTGTRAIKLTNNTDMEVLWTGPSDANGSPVFGGNTVWVMSVTNGKLYALNPTNGAVRQTLNVGHARNFTSPTIAGDKVIVATDFRVQAFKHAG
jgi:outer membrane protein assembly factor BamB